MIVLQNLKLKENMSQYLISFHEVFESYEVINKEATKMTKMVTIRLLYHKDGHKLFNGKESRRTTLEAHDIKSSVKNVKGLIACRHLISSNTYEKQNRYWQSNIALSSFNGGKAGEKMYSMEKIAM